ncbi:MAG: hypothetical protein SOT80_08900 [Candidatus Pseudoruminococcus sp.]|nr:hypothetical protein [Ruminococcus sp.]MDY2783494.1 hypothetical protein [Candidatus Pseudoruminococcus sp.]
MKKSKTILEMLLIDIFFGFIIITGFIAVYNGTTQKLEKDGYRPIEATYAYSDYVMNKNNELEKAYFLTYNINGTSYTSYVIGNAYGIDNIGSKYTIYYNPTNPSEIACPNPTGSRILIFIILSLVSVIIIIVNIKRFLKISKNKKYDY